MRIALISDAYPPLRTSAAVQMHDLAREFHAQGHEATVLVPEAAGRDAWSLEIQEGVRVVRLKSLRTKDIGYFRRTIGELLLSTMMWRNLRASPLRSAAWDGLVWYSPTIFFGALVGALKQASECRSYLVLRDIFPEWAVDMGLIGRGPIYHYFKAFERRQYAVADAIGVQSPSNLGYLRAWASTSGGRLEVLNNWLADSPSAPNPMSIAGTALAGRTILVYAGNMGVAQGMDIVFELATELRCRQDIGFLFVGRGSEVPRLKALVKARALDNVMFFEEIDPADVKGLLMQCHVGLVALDPRHKTHNVPGKFLAYMQAGLPVLARINAGNDLAQLIEKEQVGRAYVGDSVEDLRKLTEELCDHTALRESMSENARRLSVRAFSVSSAVRQITAALSAS